MDYIYERKAKKSLEDDEEFIHIVEIVEEFFDLMAVVSRNLWLRRNF
jgi:DNA segregation ATPase FtsK/SpoIIIE-like protein